MKSKLIKTLAISLLGLSSVTFVASAMFSNTAIQKAAVAEAPSRTYTNGDKDSYYNAINASESGTDLLESLRKLNLSKRKSTVGYSSMGTSPSGQFKYTDYDPATVKYDSNNQPYGTSILSFYSGISTTSWNREHVWPDSRGGGSGGSAGSPYPDADIFMPRPTITAENSQRGNSVYYEGRTSSSNGWDPVAAFEDTIGVYDNIRGECARIIFYCMTVNSKLTLNENTSNDGTNMGRLTDLLKWNLQYPVNEREVNRQEGGEYLQGNRNAFVDHPEYACKIWGNTSADTKSICQSVTPSNYLSISATSAKLSIGGTKTLTATASTGTPTISWSSNATNVATVSSAGVVTAVAAGTATITASATVGGENCSATCVITVKAASTAGDFELFTGTFEEGNYIICSGSTTAVSAAMNSTRLQEKTVEVEDDVVSSPDDDVIWTATEIDDGIYSFYNEDQGVYMASSGSRNSAALLDAETTDGMTNWTVSGSNPYEIVNSYNKSNSINANLRFNSGYGFGTYSTGTGSALTLYKEAEGSGDTPPTLMRSLVSLTLGEKKTDYYVGDAFVKPTVTANYDDHSTQEVTNKATFSGYNMSTTGTQTVTVSYSEVDWEGDNITKTATYTINVEEVPVTLSSISVSGQKTTFTVGDEFSFGGTVTAHYSDSTSANVTSSATFSGYNMSTAGTQTVTVTYQGKTTTYQITVKSSGSSGGTGYKIIWNTNSSDDGTDFTDSTLKSWTTSGVTNVASYSGISKAFKGKLGVKLGSNKATGTFTINLADDAKVTATSIKVGIANTGSTDAPIQVTTDAGSDTVTPSGTTIEDAVFAISGDITYITIANTASKAYVSYVEVICGGVTPTPKTLESISVSNAKTEYTTIESFVKPTVTAHYSDSSTATVTDSATFTGYDLSTPGTQTVTVSYEGKTTTYQITVTQATADHGKSIDDPLTVSEARSIIEAGSAGNDVWYVKGLVKKFANNGEWSTQYNNATFYMLDMDASDKTSNNDFEAYRVGAGDGINGPSIAVGDTVIVMGQLTKYNTTYETKQGTGYMVSITKLADKAAAFAASFNSANVCGTNDTTEANATIWNSMKTAFAELDIFTKEYLKNANVASEENNTIKSCIERYDRVLEVRGATGNFEDFIGRNSSTGAKSTNKSANTEIMIIAIATITCLIASVAFVLKKRKFVK